jgi:hypothetical protein
MHILFRDRVDIQLLCCLLAQLSSFHRLPIHATIKDTWNALDEAAVVNLQSSTRNSSDPE